MARLVSAFSTNSIINDYKYKKGDNSVSYRPFQTFGGAGVCLTGGRFCLFL
ncbi:hypothetical protein VCRA2128O98_110081 [Vibrio crassostreae]|nr:hypothetical protein VCRA2113O120_90105 [Vibrio crassostreae]CAK3690046.1 hypothetical protein VCRA2128O98_110081 [Vibrio crassostreae]